MCHWRGCKRIVTRITIIMDVCRLWRVHFSLTFCDQFFILKNKRKKVFAKSEVQKMRKNLKYFYFGGWIWFSFCCVKLTFYYIICTWHSTYFKKIYTFWEVNVQIYDLKRSIFCFSENWETSFSLITHICAKISKFCLHSNY